MKCSISSLTRFLPRTNLLLFSTLSHKVTLMALLVRIPLCGQIYQCRHAHAVIAGDVGFVEPFLKVFLNFTLLSVQFGLARIALFANKNIVIGPISGMFSILFRMISVP
jgi:hypothetical protein